MTKSIFYILLLLSLLCLPAHAAQVLHFSPQDDASDAPLFPTFTIIFSEPVTTQSGYITLFAYHGDALVHRFDVATEVFGSGTDSITFTVLDSLESEVQYYLTIGNAAFIDAGGNIFPGLRNKNTWNFYAVDINPPRIVSFSPPDNATGVGAVDSLVINFNEAVIESTGAIRVKRMADDTDFEVLTLPSASVTGSGTSIITVFLQAFLEAETGYYVEIDSACFYDISGNAYAGISDKITWTFSTAIDTVAPYVVTLAPPDDAANIVTNVSLNITFQKVVNVMGGYIYLCLASNDSVVETIPLPDSRITGSQTNTITINPNSDFAGNTEYFLLIDSTAFVDFSGNHYAGIYDKTGWNFTSGKDNQSPLVISFYPPDDTTGARVNDTFSITFNEPVEIKTGTISINRRADHTSHDVINLPDARVFGSGTNTIFIVPDSTLSYETAYYVRIDATCFTDISGNNFKGIPSFNKWNFTTGDNIPPSVSAFSPTDDAMAVALNSSLQITFSEPVVVKPGTITIKNGRNDTIHHVFKLPTSSVTGSNTSIITITSPKDFNAFTDYYVLIDSTAFEDVSGNPFTGISNPDTWNFITGADNVAPVVTAFFPPDGSQDMGIDENLTIIFSERVTTVTGSITIFNSADNSIFEAIALPSASVVGDSSNTITIDPANDFSLATAYYVLIDNTAFVDLAGNSFNGISLATEWNFTTVADTVSSGILLPYLGGITVLNSRLSIISPQYDPFMQLRLIFEQLPFPGSLNGLVPLDSFYLSFTLSDTAYVFTDSLEIRIQLSPSDSGAGFYTFDNNLAGWQVHRGSTMDSTGLLSLKTLDLTDYLIALDTVAPQVTVTYDTALLAVGTPCTVTVHTADNILNSKMSFFYRAGGARTYQGAAVTLSTTDTTATHVITGNLIDFKGADFQSAVDDGHHIIAHNHSFKILLENVQADTTLVFDQYRLVSLPIVPEDNALSALFFDDLGQYNRKKWRMFRWADPKFVELIPTYALALGRSYWIRTRLKEIRIDLDSAITTPTHVPFSITLSPGWNAISLPYLFTVDWQDIVQATGTDSINISGPYNWDGTDWINPLDITTLSPWQGYYVKNRTNSPITLNVPSLESQTGPGPIAKKAGRDFWMSKVSITNSQITESNDYFGILPGIPETGHNNKNFIEPPSPENKTTVTGYFIKDQNDVQYRFMSDIRRTVGKGQCWSYVVKKIRPYSVTEILFENIREIHPEKYLVYLYDLTRNCAFDLRKCAAYEFHTTGKTERRFKILVGNSQYISRMTDGRLALPVTFSLGQNYPNPFNPLTTIRYAVPVLKSGKSRPVEVNLSVYNLKGQRIACLALGKHDPGYYKTTWDGKTFSGKEVGTGTYFLRMHAGSHFTKVRKMVIIK